MISCASNIFSFWGITRGHPQTGALVVAIVAVAAMLISIITHMFPQSRKATVL